MAKHLIDLDMDALQVARAALGTLTTTDTVNASLRLAAAGNDRRAGKAVEALADADLADRQDAWR